MIWSILGHSLQGLILLAALWITYRIVRLTIEHWNTNFDEE